MVRMSSVAMLAFDCECKNKQNRDKKNTRKRDMNEENRS